MPAEVVIRDAAPIDWPRIRLINDAAFGGPAESALVDRLRGDGLAVAELVAVRDGTPVGHLMLSKLAVEVDGRPVKALALAPMTVTPDHQRHSIGAALVRGGLKSATERGWQAVIVLGHRDYYPRFWFSAAMARHLSAPYAGPSFMAIKLVAGVLAGRAGSVTYPGAFAEVD